jgi:hypothetical protein
MVCDRDDAIIGLVIMSAGWLYSGTQPSEWQAALSV